MRYILALLLPWLCFLVLGKPIHGIISLVLQLSVIGWPIATIWAFYGISERRQQIKAKYQAQAAKTSAQATQAQATEPSTQTIKPSPQTTEETEDQPHEEQR